MSDRKLGEAMRSMHLFQMSANCKIGEGTASFRNYISRKLRVFRSTKRFRMVLQEGNSSTFQNIYCIGIDATLLYMTGLTYSAFS